MCDECFQRLEQQGLSIQAVEKINTCVSTNIWMINADVVDLVWSTADKLSSKRLVAQDEIRLSSCPDVSFWCLVAKTNMDLCIKDSV